MLKMFSNQHTGVKLMMNHSLNNNNAMIACGLSWVIMVKLQLYVKQKCLLTDYENNEVKFLKFCIYKM